MRRRRLIGAATLVVASLFLAGCTTGGPTSAPSSASESPSPTSTPVVASGLVISLDAISVANGDGSTGDSAPFSDGAATLALVSRVLGSTPTPDRDDDFGSARYDWGGLMVYTTKSDGSASVVFSVPELGGVALRTAEGIEVGSTLAEVEAVASPGTEYAPAGRSDAYYGLEARVHPGTDSLTFPGRVGMDYIGVSLTDGVVVSLDAPGGDWHDV
jgi:hypothetical protein